MPPERTALSAGSTATALNDGFLGLMYSQTPVMCRLCRRPNQNVHAPVGVVPDLRAGGFEVNLGIGRIVELLQHVAVGSIGQNLFRFHDRARHSPRTGSKHDLRAEASSRTRRSRLMVSGIVEDQLVSFTAATNARPIPVLPLVGSISTVLPG